MATWQFDLEMVPQGLAAIPIDEPWADVEPPPDWEALVANVLPAATSWDPVHLRTWGTDDGHRLDVWVDDGRLRSILVRIDARQRDCDSICSRIAHLAHSLRALFRTSTGLIVEPSLTALADALEGSAAKRFVRDPELFFRRLRLGGYEDA